jgi:ATPase subunit of ABC transporter with duplicated ATPase domains
MLAVEALRLRKRYGQIEALRGVDLDVQTGTVVGLLGPNGAGKTTAVRILVTLLRPDEGTRSQHQRRAASLQPADAPEGVRGREEDRYADERDEHSEPDRHARHEHDEGDDAGRPAEQEVGQLTPGTRSNRPDQGRSGSARRVHVIHDKAAGSSARSGYQASPSGVSRSTGESG